MNSKTIKAILVVLILTTIGMGAYVYNIYKQTAEPIKPVHISSPTIAEIPPPDRAFIQLGNMDRSTSAGKDWTINITTNTWAKCLADVYDPDDGLFAIGKEAAEATFVSPGKFTWKWDVPNDAKEGEWTIRFLCGTYENLATADQAVLVN
ncbi:MAG: hypothetical protein ABII13_04055 [Patescibacteria group bacterium]|nr:hypothetical protein [Patescibacteria group bacterium]MBU2509379.1 hypothetical protein [Patescibacteria group bacterium]